MSEATKAYDEKIREELKQVKAQLADLEARSKAEDKQVAADLVNQLKATHREIDKKREEIKKSAVDEMKQEQEEINAGIAKLKSGLAELDRKLNPDQPANPT